MRKTPFAFLASLLLLLPAFAASVRAASLVPPGPAPAVAGSLIQLNDFGSGDIAYFAIPNVPPKGGVVVVHDQWGLDDRIKAVVEHFADCGYIAVAPDLFNGQLPTDAVRASDAARSLSRDSALATISASVRFLRESPRFRSTRVAVVGWGLGAGLAWEASVPAKGRAWANAAAAVGTPADVDWGKVARGPLPVLACLDPSFPAASRADFDAALAQKKDFEIHDLPAELPPAQVWPCLLAFLDRTFAQPVSDGFLTRMNPFKSGDDTNGGGADAAPKAAPSAPAPAP